MNLKVLTELQIICVSWNERNLAFQMLHLVCKFCYQAESYIRIMLHLYKKKYVPRIFFVQP